MINLINADARAAIKEIESESVDSIVTDPPYQVFKGRIDFEAFELDAEFLNDCFRVLKPGGFSAFFFHPPTYHRIATKIEAAGFDIVSPFAWVFATGRVTSKGRARPAFELIAVGVKPSPNGTPPMNIEEGRIAAGDDYFGLQGMTQGNAGRSYSDLHFPKQKKRTFEPGSGRYPTTLLLDDDADLVEGLGDRSRFFYCPKVRRRDEFNDHPTVKPVELCEYIVKILTPPRGLVLDPFMGSGSIGIAALASGRSYTGIEIDPHFFDISRRRVTPDIL